VTAPAADHAAPRCAVESVPARLPAARRVVAIGDLHGDLAAARAALKLAGAIDDHDAWIGGALVVVQLGDVLDRGDGEQAIVDLFEKLEGEAKAAGGALIWLLGNHELMNASGDFRYVTKGGYADFADVAGLDLHRPELEGAPEPVKPRAAAMLPGGPYAHVMSGQRTMVVVGDTAFVHGGFRAAWSKAHAPSGTTDLDAVNHEVQCWLDGAGRRPAIAEDPDGPLWSRLYGGDNDGEATCRELSDALAALHVERMVVAHTPQLGGITNACGGRVWRVDVGLAAYYQGPLEVLELGDGAPKVLKGSR
jgi:hypothetical protein